MSLVEFKNVSKIYKDHGQEIVGLEDTNFSLNPGEFVAVIGPSGSGKSTLLTLMGGLQKPTKGQILLDGIDMVNATEKERQRYRFDKIGFVLQQSNLLPYLTIKEQLVLVSKVAGEKFEEGKAIVLLESLGIAEYANSYPRDLSGGQKQRAAIARAISPDPTMILADEPTASLDTQKAFDVVRILSQKTKERKKVTVMVTHDERLLEYCDRVFVITDGTLEERK